MRRKVALVILLILEIAVIGLLFYSFLIQEPARRSPHTYVVLIMAGLIFFVFYVIYLKLQAGKVQKKAIVEKLKTHVIVDNMPYAVIILDMEDTIIMANPKAHEMLRLAPAEAIGKNISEFFTEESLQTIKNRTHGRFLMSLKKIPENIKVQISDVKDEQVKILLLYPSIREETVVSQKTDIQTEHSLQRKMNEFAVYSRQLLKDSLDKALSETEERKKFFVRTFIINRKMQNFLDFVIEPDKIKKETFPVLETIKQVIDTYTPIIELKQLRVEFDAERDYNITADKELLKRVFDEILLNSISYSNWYGFIKISLTGLDSEIKISFLDNGLGIDEQDLHRIWDKGFIGKVQIPETTKGAGMGLFIVKNIIEAHGGSSLVESKKGAGTKITLTLPKG